MNNILMTRAPVSRWPAPPTAPGKRAPTIPPCRWGRRNWLHVRRADGTHSLAPADCRPAIEAVRRAVGDELVLQLTTEAVGIYTPAQQIAAMRELAPDAAHEREAAAFFAWLANERIVPQYILYAPEDTARYVDLRQRGVIPAGRHWVLFVLGRYSAGQKSSPSDLLPFLRVWHDNAAATQDVPWSMCAFGAREADCAVAAAMLGGHVRLGFENNLLMPNGSTARDNAALIANFAGVAATLACPLATAGQLRQWFD